MTAIQKSEPRLGLSYRIVAAWMLGFVALAVSGWIGEFIEQQFGAGNIVRILTQSAIMAGLVLPGIIWMRKRVDQRPLDTMGLVGPRNAIPGFLVGAGMIFLPLFLTLMLAALFGWVNFRAQSIPVCSFNVSGRIFCRAVFRSIAGGNTVPRLSVF